MISTIWVLCPYLTNDITADTIYGEVITEQYRYKMVSVF